MTTRPQVVFLLLMGTALAGVRPVRAGNDIYFVTYNHHINKGETELMVMTDFTIPRERTPEVGTYMSNMIELEYGFTHQWASELMLEGFFDFDRQAARYTGFRWENRYRLQRAANKGLNPVLYMEYEDLDAQTRFKMEVSGREDGKGEPAGPEPERERILETRIILSRDFGPYNVAFNWINEMDLQRRLFTDYGYALGFRKTLGDHHHGADEDDEDASPTAGAAPYRCPMHPDQTANQPGKCPVCGMALEPAGRKAGRRYSWKPTGIGFELYGGLGNSGAFGGPFKVQPHYLQPIVMFHPAPNVMVHIAPAFGLTPVSDDLFRTAVGFEF